MILNAYAVLDAFVSLLRLGLGLPLVWFAVVTWGRWRRSDRSPAHRQELEDRSYLLFLLAGLLLALNLLAWPLLYLLLQSYVTEWPGVMCIYGVTRVGRGSLGSSRYLPTLLTALQAAKPLLVFLSGAWFVLHLVNRRTRTAPFTGRILLVLFAASLLGSADAATELAYLVIPKKEELLSSGCCMAAYDLDGGPGRFVPPHLLGENSVGWLSAAYYAFNAGMVVALATCVRVGRHRATNHLPTTLPNGRRYCGWLAPLLAAALATLAVDTVFLTEVAAPRLLRMPDHHCPYDLVSVAPRSLGAVALFVGSTFCVGWACVVGWFGRGPESESFGAGVVGTLLRLAAVGYGASVLILSAELMLA